MNWERATYFRCVDLSLFDLTISTPCDRCAFSDYSSSPEVLHCAWRAALSSILNSLTWRSLDDADANQFMKPTSARLSLKKQIQPEVRIKTG